MFNHRFTSLKKPLYWASFIIMLDTLSYGLIMPVMPDLLLDLGCTSLSDAAFYGGMLSAAFALMQFVFGPLIGNLSDRFGRRPILLVSLTVLFIHYLFNGLAQSIWLLFAGKIICGIGLANYSTAFAVIADVSHPKEKAASFGLLGTALSFGFILGAIIGGLISPLGLREPFYLAAIISLGNLIFGFIFVEETFDSQKRRQFTWFRTNPLRIFLKAPAPEIARLMLVIFFYELAFSVYQATWAYFTRERFGWNADFIGISLGVFGITAALMQGLAIRFFLSRFSEYKTAAFALIVNVLVFLLFACVSHAWMIFALIPLSALATIFLPSVQSILTRLVKDDSYGELQGIVTSIRAVSITIGPPLMTGIFSFFISDKTSLFFPGAPFLFASLISSISLIIFLSAHQHILGNIHKKETFYSI